MMTFDQFLIDTYGPNHGLSGSEMDIAKTAWLAAHEQCALLCESAESAAWALWDARADQIDQGAAIKAADLADKIREAPAPPKKLPAPSS
jgi:hypothetical protein